MNRTDINESRRRLHELAETQHWAHHVADLDSGKILTFPLDRPVAPLSRAKRLLLIGHRVDPQSSEEFLRAGTVLRGRRRTFRTNKLAAGSSSVYNADLLTTEPGTQSSGGRHNKRPTLLTAK